ncbi:hypothetical protein EVAR_17252_1 [Eumeta japonica]|uniref:Uncharacterized protein n=1 Tax=Eumeta variegata TaxID=151549 RepID=A0A4C1TSZ4_EUMVA|nr:hypothetical protein EVAR_17252_1 [Eumeta japonica]
MSNLRSTPCRNLNNLFVEADFVAIWLEGIRFYSWYAPPSLSSDEFDNFLDQLTKDTKQHHPVAIAMTVTKHLEKINLALDITFGVDRWMNTVNLQLAQHKTKAVLITSRKQAETISLSRGARKYITTIHSVSRSNDRCLTQFQTAGGACKCSASAVRASLSRLTPYVGGPKQSSCCRQHVVTSVLTLLKLKN